MKVYLGSSCHMAAETHRRAEELRALGHDVVSRWTERPLLVHLTEQDMKEIAWADYRELMSAVAVVIDCSVPSSSGGLATEIGLAIASRKTLYIVAPDKNVFARLATKMLPTWDDFMKFLTTKSATELSTANNYRVSDPMTPEQIDRLAKDGDRFENEFGIEDSRIIYDDKS